MSTIPPPVTSPIPNEYSQMSPDQYVSIEEIDRMREVISEFKPGYKTSEFWESAAATLVPLGAFAARVFGYEVDTEVLLASLGGFIPNAAYILNRGWVKRRRLEAIE